LAGASVGKPMVAAGATHVFHLYVVRATRREELKASLAEAGIDALIHYPVPIHLQPAYRGRLRTVGELPQTARAAKEVLSLPMYPELTLQDQDFVVDAVRSFARL
jgi:dTDP-4-amino-4,6-dideoxygalactose transaminase